MISNKMQKEDIDKFCKKHAIVEKDENYQVVSVIVPTIPEILFKNPTFKKLDSNEKINKQAKKTILGNENFIF